MRLKKIVRLSTLLAGLLICSDAAAIEQADTPPNFSLRTADGQTVSLSDYRGKVVYLDFWASWCGPCKRTLPWMQQLQQRFNARGFEVVAVNLDTTRAEAEKLLGGAPVSFTVLFDPSGTVASKYEIPSMPTSMLIGRDGRVVAVHSGFENGDGVVIEQQIANLLNTTTSDVSHKEARR